MAEVGSKTTNSEDRDWLLKAIDLSRNCPPTQKAFSVGAIILGANGEIVSTGFSRERGPSDHAEEVAIAKANEAGISLKGAAIYCSLEPCCPRLSGKTSCADLIIKASIKRVVFAWHEPPVFVVCNGTNHLRENGVEVLVLDEFAALVQELNTGALNA